MRTTLDIPDQLMAEALRATQAKTKTTVIILGLQELINRHRLNQLRTLRGNLPLTTHVSKARKRTSA